jgi:1-acyl-sn-glycerol-3-phosphate acyltransferase
MLYYLLRPLTRLAFLGFYRRIHLSGLAEVPASGPLIFTANHPTAFIEPCFLACYSGRTLHFMTRGDVFVNPWVHRLLRQVHLIPVYRFRDGYGNLRRNEDSFREARRVLARNNTVLIMAEGGMRHEKRLRPIRKGAARLAFDALEKDGLSEVFIQPVAVNYAAADQARSEMMVAFAPPFGISAYLDLYREKPQAALDAVTARIADELQARVIHIERTEDEALCEYLLDLLRDPAQESWWPVLIRDRQALGREKAVTDGVNLLPAPAREKLSEACKAWQDALSRSSISCRDFLLVFRSAGPASLWNLGWWSGLHAITMLPIALPLWLSRTITRTTVKEIEFRSSILMASLMLTGLLWYALCAMAAFMTLGLTAFLTVLLIWPLSTILYIRSLPAIERLQAHRRWYRLAPAQRQALITQRESLLALWHHHTEKMEQVE